MASLFGLSENWTSLVILLALIAIIYIVDRKNFKREGIVFMRRTKKGLEFIDNFAKKHGEFFTKFGSFGVMLSFGTLGVAYILYGQKKKFIAKISILFVVVFALLGFILKPYAAASVSLFGAAGFIILQLLMGVIGIFSLKTTAAPLQLVLPVQTTAAPVFFVPIDYWLISIFVIMIVHEFSHAFVARAENIRVKSIGYGFAAILPLGFAEPDEAQLKKSESLKKSRVFAAGSLSNILAGTVAIILFALMAFAASAMFVSEGVAYSQTAEGSPVENVLPASGTITEINGKNISGIDELSAVMENITAGSRISLVVDNKDYALVTASKDNTTKSFIGIVDLKNRVVPKEKYASVMTDPVSGAFFYIISLLRWLFMLNIGVGLANLLPLKPLDGGLIFEEIIKKFCPKSWKSIYGVVAMTTLGLILLNLFGVYIVRAVGAVV